MRLFYFPTNLALIITLAITANLTLTSCCYSQDILNLRAAKDIVQDYYESGKYEEELEKIYAEAKTKIDKISVQQNSAAIFDVDDTALSNYEISKRLDFGYDYQIVQDWVMSGRLPAIKQTKEFYDYLKSKGLKIIFLTGRQYEEYDATYQNLIKTGYTGFDTLIVRNKRARKISASEFKASVRRELSTKGYDIILCVGDQWTDLEGDNTGIKVKIPNYLYEIK